VSISGQIVTGILVITGMVFVGVFTATLTSLFVGEQSGELERLQDELGSKIDQIAERLEQLERH
jgi:TM2 domain-containing membrane protein YozV